MYVVQILSYLDQNLWSQQILVKQGFLCLQDSGKYACQNTLRDEMCQKVNNK